MRGARLLPVVLLGLAVVALLAVVGVVDVAALRDALGLGPAPEGVAPEAIDGPAADARPGAPPLAAAGARRRTPDELAAEAAAAAAAASAAARPDAPLGLDGVVVRGDGRPASGARVALLGADGATFSAVVDGDGKFRVEAPAGRYDLLVRGGLDGALFLADVWVDGRPLAGVLELAPAVTVRVEASLEGRPLEGAPVRLRWAPEGGAAPREVAAGATDRDGAFEGEALPPGRYAVEVDAAPGVTATRAVDAPQHVTVAVKFPALGRWTGRVTDATTGVPLPAQVVLLVGLDDGALVRAAALADGAGVFAVVAPRGQARQVYVEAPGYAPFPSARGEANALVGALATLRREDVVRDVTLKRGAAIVGVVTHADTKAPVPGVTVELRGDGVRLAPELLAAGRVATTGDDGAYLATGIAPGGWTASVTSPGWYVEGPVKVRVNGPDASGRVADARLDLVVRGAGIVAGRVTRADGTPAARARVWLAGGGGTVRSARQSGRLLETLAADDGGFRLDDVPPAEWIRVRAALGDDEATPSAAFRLMDATPPPFLLVLGPTVTVHGRVTDLVTREPVPNAKVRLDATGEPGGRGSRTVTTAADGTYEVAGLVPGPWHVTPERRPSYVPSPGVDVTAAAGTPRLEVPLVLDPGLVIAGVVLDGTGAAFGNVRVTLNGREDVGTPPPNVSRSLRAGNDGSFRFVGLLSGSYVLEVRAGGQVRARLEGLRGGERTLTIRASR